ncbi:MAG: hypothetical protein AB1529_04185 [Candidatus Micrarchaeota archaeon]
MAGGGIGVPRRTDPFEEAFAAVGASERRGGYIHFGARRTNPHNGIDLAVPEGTPIQVPASRAVLIGITREGSAAGRSMGNALIFFVPDERRPYFLALLHLSPRTFAHLRRSHVSIGSEMSSGPGTGSVVAYSGSSAIQSSAPHVHVTATTEFMFGGRVFTARNFLAMERGGELARYLRGKNFFALQTRARIRQPDSLSGYMDPAALMRDGSLRLSSQPQPALLASEGGRDRKLAAR